MPEIAIDEYGELPAWYGYVRASDCLLVVLLKINLLLPQVPEHESLRLRPFRLDQGHYLAPFLFAEDVSH